MTEEDVQGLETDRLNHEEVGRPDALELVGQECAPTLSVRLPVRAAPAIAPDGAVADDDAELEQLSPDPLGSPQTVVARHRGDQLADLGSKPEPTSAAARAPGPVEPPALAVPADHSLGTHDRNVLSPSDGPQATEPDPEDAVGAAEARTGVCPESNVKLMAKGEVLEGEVTVRSPKGQYGTQGD